MKRRSPIQRFLRELRRRHVPQTAAVYMVAAWAAIQFADVVVPNLGGSDSIITAVIIAALVGLPVVLALAWIFDWGPEGIQRTSAPPEPAEDHIGTAGQTSSASTREPSGPWVTAVSVLVVGIASALGVALVLEHASDGAGDEGIRAETDAPAEAPVPGTGRAGGDGGGAGGPETPFIPDVPPGILSPEFSDSIRALVQNLTQMERMDSLPELMRVAERFGTGRSLLIGSPTSWNFGPGPEPLLAGDTLEVMGVARDTAGVLSVSVDDQVVAEAEEPEETLSFLTELVGTGSRGMRTVTITIRTADGRTIARQYRIQQLPGA